MRAEEAKKLAFSKHAEKIATQYADILSQIQRRASDGHLQTIYHGYMFPENLEALKLLGYKIQNDKGTDSLMIAWYHVDTPADSSIILP